MKIGRPRHEHDLKSEFITVRVDKDTKDAIMQLAECKHLKLSELVIKALKSEIREA